MPKDLNVKEILLNHFKIIILWSFGNFPSHNTGMRSHFTTINPEGLNQYQQNIVSPAQDGWNKKRMLEIVNNTRNEQKEEFRKTLIRNEAGINPNEINQIFRLPFTKNPIMKQ